MKGKKVLDPSVYMPWLAQRSFWFRNGHGMMNRTHKVTDAKFLISFLASAKRASVNRYYIAADRQDQKAQRIRHAIPRIDPESVGH